MADSNDPKSETAHVPVPLRPQPTGSETRDPVRINLPLRPPSNLAPRPTPEPPNRLASIPRSPNPTPPSPLRPPVSQETGATTPGPGPKKETARITVLSSPPKALALVRTENTPPFDHTSGAQSSVVPAKVIATETGANVDAIPKSLCWTLLGASVAILLIQIWNYLS